MELLCNISVLLNCCFCTYFFLSTVEIALKLKKIKNRTIEQITIFVNFKSPNL